jgi:hypothetical protein
LFAAPGLLCQAAVFIAAFTGPSTLSHGVCVRGSADERGRFTDAF